MKKITAFILAFILILSCTVTASASNPTSYYKYIIENGEVTLTYAHTSKDVLNIPARIEGYPVTKIKSDVFFNLFRLGNFEAINIPASVTCIETPVIFDIVGVKAINVDKNNPAYSSKDGVLFNKDKTTIIFYPNEKGDSVYKLPEGVVRIEDYAFRYADTKEIVLPESLEEIGENAFFKAGYLEKLHLPKNVRLIGNDAFVLNYNLSKVTVDKENPYFSDLNGVLYNKDKTAILYYPVNKEGESYEIPETVTTIGFNAFQWLAPLTSVKLPEGLRKIDDKGLSGSSKLFIELPENLEYIGNNALESCGFKTITLPEGISYIGEETFAYAYSLQKITIPHGVTEIRDGAFMSCASLDEVVIPGTVTKIGEKVFDYCKEKIVIYGFSGSASEAVADYYGYEFISIDHTYTANVKGDANLDGKLNIRDSTLIQKQLVKVAVLGDTAQNQGDFDENQKLNIRDATAIQKYIARKT